MAEARAVLRFVRVAPRKARPVVDMIRGQEVPMALAMLKHLPRHAARVIEKVLRSAVANAEQKELGDSESMRVSKAFVNCGPIYKRFRARSMGRANAIHEPHHRRRGSARRTGEITGLNIAGIGRRPPQN
jgi:large subunit ribosomal protein L22